MSQHFLVDQLFAKFHRTLITNCAHTYNLTTSCEVSRVFFHHVEPSSHERLWLCGRIGKDHIIILASVGACTLDIRGVASVEPDHRDWPIHRSERVALAKIDATMPDDDLILLDSLP